MNAWLSQHAKAFSWALQRLTASPANTLLSLIAIGVALALPAGGQMLLGNALQFARNADNVNAAPQISLFLSLDADKKTADGIATRLRNHAGVKQARFISREETLKRMQSGENLAEVLAALPRNPLSLEIA